MAVTARYQSPFPSNSLFAGKQWQDGAAVFEFDAVKIQTKKRQHREKEQETQALLTHLSQQKSYSKQQILKKQKQAKAIALIPPVIAAAGKAFKDGFGAMTVYSLIAFQELKLTATLLNPWIGIPLGILMVALFVISMGMEGKALRARILAYLSKRAGVDLSQDYQPMRLAQGFWPKFGLRVAIGCARVLKHTAPWTAAVCKGISGLGGTAGCLLLVLASMGVITSTAIAGSIPWIIIGFSAIVGVTQMLVSRYKEGDDFITEANRFINQCRARLGLPAIQFKSPTQLGLPKTKAGLSAEDLQTKKTWVRRLSSIPPVIAALGRAFKDGFGAMALYALIAVQALKLTPALLNPWIGVIIGVLAVSLFFISMGMEGKSLRIRMIGYFSKHAGVDLAHDDMPLQPVKGSVNRMGMYFLVGCAKVLRATAPWTAATCKGVSGMGSTAGSLLLVAAGVGIIATTAIAGPVPIIALCFSAIVGVTLALVSRYKEGDDFKVEADKFEARCWARLSLPQQQASAPLLASTPLATTASPTSAPASPANTFADINNVAADLVEYEYPPKLATPPLWSASKSLYAMPQPVRMNRLNDTTIHPPLWQAAPSLFAQPAVTNACMANAAPEPLLRTITHCR